MKKAFLLPALIISAAAAQAQPTGSRISQDEFGDAKQEDSREVRLVGVRYGDCVVGKNRAAASAYVLSQGIEMEEGARRRLIDRVNDGYCLTDATKSFGDVQMRLPADTLRYTLADALFRAQPLAGPLTIPATLPALTHPTIDEAEYRAALAKGGNKRKLAELTANRAKALGRILLSDFGECVVRANPAGAHALLSTSVLSPEENRAFAVLRPAFGQCLYQGQTLEMNKAILRGTVALNHYRLAQAMRQAQ